MAEIRIFRTITLQTLYTTQIRLKNLVSGTVRPGFIRVSCSEQGKHRYFQPGGKMHWAAVIAKHKTTSSDGLLQNFRKECRWPLFGRPPCSGNHCSPGLPFFQTVFLPQCQVFLHQFRVIRNLGNPLWHGPSDHPGSQLQIAFNSMELVCHFDPASVKCPGNPFPRGGKSDHLGRFCEFGKKRTSEQALKIKYDIVGIFPEFPQYSAESIRETINTPEITAGKTDGAIDKR